MIYEIIWTANAEEELVRLWLYHRARQSLSDSIAYFEKWIGENPRPRAAREHEDLWFLQVSPQLLLAYTIDDERFEVLVVKVYVSDIPRPR